MRRTITLLTALALVFAASCQRIEETTVQDGSVSDEQITIEATIAETNPSATVPGDEPQTKTALQENGVDIWWTPGDAINVFYGSASSGKFTSSLTEPQALAAFSGSVGTVTGTAQEGMGAQTFWGVYPYDAANTCDGSSVTLKILGTQVASPGSFGKGMNPSVANSPGLGLSFYNVGSWFRFSVTQSGITSATFSGNNGEILAGKVTVKMDSDKKPLISKVADGKTSITVTPEGGGSFVPNKYYYITLIPQTIGGTGYTLTLYKGAMVANCVVADPAKTYAFKRSEYRSKTNADAGLTWEDDYVEMAEGFNWAKVNIGATSPEGYGDRFAWGETSPRNSYTSGNYDYLIPFSDAAKANWGDDWRTPTSAEWEALLDENNYTWEWTTENGVNGYRVTSKVAGYAGNSIFLPATGYSTNGNVWNAGTAGYYWSSSLNPIDSRKANSFYFSSSYLFIIKESRYFGYPIRAIYDPSSVPPVSPEVPVTGVSFDMATYAVLDRGTFALPVTISPSNATIQDLTWVSSNPEVAVVSPTGGVTGMKVGTTTITTRTVDGGYRAACTVKVIPYTSYIDMGNGTKWATVNVGADSPEEYGGYFAWGETQMKTGSYNWSTYQYCTGGSESSINKYTPTDGKTVLEAGDDAATVNLGSNWRMATDAEWTWLLEHCTWTWCEMNGVKGCLVTSNVSGNSSIFLPAAGNKVMSQTGNVGTRGRYWTSSADDLRSWSVDISSDGPIHESAQRIRGYSVRGVYEPHQFINGHEYVEMGDGLKWATCNVGADSPGAYGDYFAWGETEPKSSYSSESYDYNLTFSDAAAANWGSTWRMPTVEEWRALMNSSNFDWEWDDVMKGCKVTSKVPGYEGNSIFLPAAGSRFYSRLDDAGSCGLYWIPSLYQYDEGSSMSLYFFESEEAGLYGSTRYLGAPVRPVSN